MMGKAAICGMLLFFSAVCSAYEFDALGAHWSVHGTFSQGWIHSENNNFIEDSVDGSFDFREFGINATAAFGENITIGAQGLGRVFGAVGGDELYLDWANIAYTPSSLLGFRFGKMRVPFGLYGETRDIDSLRTQILLPQSVYVETYRSSMDSMWGASVFGDWYTDHLGAFSYSLQFGESDINEDTGELDRLLPYFEIPISSANDGESGALKIVWDSPNQSLRLGMTYAYSDFSIVGSEDWLAGQGAEFETEAKDYYFWITSAQYHWRDLLFTWERLQSDMVSDFSLSATVGNVGIFSNRVRGQYLNVDYLLKDDTTLGLGFSVIGQRQKVVMGELLEDLSFKDKQYNVYLSLRYDLTENIIFKIEQHRFRGTSGLFASENPDGLKKNWSMTAVKLSFVY